MKVFNICFDGSSQFYQDFNEYGFYSTKESAMRNLEAVIRKEENEVSEDLIRDFYNTGEYILPHNLGTYYVREIEVEE